MAEKGKKALGRGLDSIFGSDVGQFLDDLQNHAQDIPGRKSLEIKVNEIRVNPYQPRKEFDLTALNELAESIRQHGIFTPLLVRKSVKGYELIAGERRLRAAKLAKKETVPVICVDFTDEQMMEISLLENIQRENLSVIEEAAAYESLVKRLNYTQEKLAERVGKSREHCANMLRLLKLPSEVQQMVSQKKLTMGHVRPLLALKDEDQMYDAAQHIMKEKMSVREVEKYIKDLTAQPGKSSKTQVKDPLLVDLESRLSKKLSTKVDVQKKALLIHFTNTEDLNRILELLGCIESSEME